MKPLFQPLMLSCKKASALSDKASIIGLNKIEQFRLKMHINACDFCRAYQRHGEIIDKAIRSLSEGHLQERLSLSESIRQKILLQIANQ
jgi:hypothetical protein